MKMHVPVIDGSTSPGVSVTGFDASHRVFGSVPFEHAETNASTAAVTVTSAPRLRGANMALLLERVRTHARRSRHASRNGGYGVVPPITGTIWRGEHTPYP